MFHMLLTFVKITIKTFVVLLIVLVFKRKSPDEDEEAATSCKLF